MKTQAFARLFERYGPSLVARVRKHHEANGGMSRFDKIPLYLKWAGQDITPALVDEYCKSFGALARQAVVDSPWVPGAYDLVRRNPYNQTFVLITATPEDEIEIILSALGIRQCFAAVCGAPTNKADAIGSVLAKGELQPQECLVIGDAKADFDAACAHAVPFLLRRHATNARVFEANMGWSITDFNELWTD